MTLAVGVAAMVSSGVVQSQDALASQATTHEPQVDCSAFANDRFMVLSASPATARQGETLMLRARVPQGPYAPKQVPITCLTDWVVSPPGAATLSSADGRLTIAMDAPAPEILTLTAQAPGGQVQLKTTLVGRDEVVLTGRWSQIEIDCGDAHPPREPVRELEFDALGGFTVTYMPFETYRDYWGQAAFVAAEERLTLTMTGGNATPSDPILNGAARIDSEGRLILDGFNLGEREPTERPGPCRYTFSRM